MSVHMIILRIFIFTLTLIRINAVITEQYRNAVSVNVSAVLSHQDSKESVTRNEIQCAASTEATRLYCYSSSRCIEATEIFPAINGFLMNGWTCKTMCEWGLNISDDWYSGKIYISSIIDLLVNTRTVTNIHILWKLGNLGHIRLLTITILEINDYLIT